MPASASFPGREKERVEICWKLVHVLFWGAWCRENLSPVVQVRKHGEIVKTILTLGAEPLAHFGNGRGPVSLSK